MSENEGKLYDALQAFAESVIREAEKLKNFAIAFKTGNPALVPKPASQLAPVQAETPQAPAKPEAVWIDKTGDNGPFQLSNDMENPVHQQLHAWLKGEKQNKGFKDGYFYWLFADQVAIGRKKVQRREKR